MTWVIIATIEKHANPQMQQQQQQLTSSPRQQRKTLHNAITQSHNDEATMMPPHIVIINIIVLYLSVWHNPTSEKESCQKKIMSKKNHVRKKWCQKKKKRKNEIANHWKEGKRFDRCLESRWTLMSRKPGMRSWITKMLCFRGNLHPFLRHDFCDDVHVCGSGTSMNHFHQLAFFF